MLNWRHYDPHRLSGSTIAHLATMRRESAGSSSSSSSSSATWALKILNDAAYGESRVSGASQGWRWRGWRWRDSCSASCCRLDKLAAWKRFPRRFLACERARRSPPECSLPGNSSRENVASAEFQRLEQGGAETHTRSATRAWCVHRHHLSTMLQCLQKKNAPDRISRLVLVSRFTET